MKLINNSSIEFTSPLLKDLDNLQYIDINGIYNCCSEFNQRLTVHDTANNRLCSASYCNYAGQSQPCGDKYPDNCLNPQGSYYFRLTTLLFYINGALTNILDRSYNMTQETDIAAALLNIKAKLPEEVIVDIKGYYNNLNYLCVSLEFLDLPNGIVPVNFVLRNDDTCFIKTDFECLEVIPNSECTKFITTFDLNTIYDLKTITIDNIEYALNIEFDLTVSIGAMNAALVTNITNINSLIAATGVVLTYTIEENKLVLRYNRPTTNKLVDIIYALNTTDNNYYNFTFRCEEQSILPIKPIYTTTIYIDDDNTYDTIYAFNVLNGVNIGPVNILETPILFNNINTLPTVLATADPTLNMTIVRTLDSTGFIITINNSQFTPYDIILHSDYSDYKVYSFGVTQLLNFSTNYDASLVEYLHNNLYIKSKFFGFTNYFVDGIYTININLVTESDIHNYKFCKFVFQNVCDITKLYDEDSERGRKAILLKELIEEATTCGCDCEEACKLYKEFTDLLYGSKCLV